MEKKNLRQLVAFLRTLGVNKVKLSENSADLYGGIIELELGPKEPRKRTKKSKAISKQPLEKDPKIETDEPVDFLHWSTFQIEENN